MREGLADYVPHVYRFALRLTGDPHRAEDLTQETFLRAWQRRTQLKDERAARVWLFRIAVNLWNDELRRGGTPDLNAKSLTGTVAAHVGARAAPPERIIEDQEELVQALKLLDALPPRQRTVLYLVAVEELSLSEVGEILRIKKNAAKVSLSLARKRMREASAKLT